MLFRSQRQEPLHREAAQLPLLLADRRELRRHPGGGGDVVEADDAEVPRDAQVQGVAKLTDPSASLSRFLGWRILTQDSAPLLPTEGVNKLSKTASPLSSLLSIPTTVRSGASLSSIFGLPLLLNGDKAKQ